MVTIEAATVDEFSAFSKQMSQVVESVLGRPYFGFSPTDAWRPAVNLYETESGFMVCVDLAGMDKNEIDVQIEKCHLVIRGRRTSPLPPDGARAVAVHLMEIDHGTFCRSVEIPANVEAERIEANYHMGMLWISLPKQKKVSR